MSMNPSTQHAAETVGGLATKAAPPVSVSVASVAGVPLSDLVLWATLIYTSLMIGHTIWKFVRDVRGVK